VVQRHDHAAEKTAKDPHSHDNGDRREGFVKLTAAQLRAAGIETAPVTGGKLVKEIVVPGRITINADRQSKIVPRISGAVVKITKRLGEAVGKNEVLAVLESREMADGKAEYLAARRAEELAKSILDRHQRLWNDKAVPEKELIASRNAQQHALIKLDLAHQRLHTMGLSELEIDALPASADETTFRFYEIRSPIAGRVTARNVLLGQAVTTDKDIFTVAELSTVWIELAVAPVDLPLAKEGQQVRIYAGTIDDGKTRAAWRFWAASISPRRSQSPTPSLSRPSWARSKRNTSIEAAP
jgi:cobalt-zinc-cadmium efflux system membrane fusion protein